MIHQQRGRTSQAKKAYLEAVALDPKQAIAFNNLAFLAIGEQSRLDDALHWAQQAVELAPAVAPFQDTLGWVHRARSEFTEAVMVLKKAAALDPRQAEIHYHLGIAYAESGKPREAGAALRKALEIGGDFEGAKDARRRLDELAKP
jgi:Flp pilus assembly protein TadD